MDRIDDRTTFVALSFVVRIVEALGDAAFVTASFAIIAAEFPDSVATTFVRAILLKKLECLNESLS